MSDVGNWLLAAALGALFASLWQQTRVARLRERLRLAERDHGRVQAAEDAATDLRVEIVRLEAAREADTERLAWIHTADEQLRASFQQLANTALEQQGERLSTSAQESVAPLVAGVERTLGELAREVRTLESQRQEAYTGLHKEIALLREAHRQLRDSASGLASALRSPNTSGRWGEIQLRRVVEMAGMVARVDFTEQPVLDRLRPDMVIHLPDGAAIPVDAKAPLKAFLAAAEARSDPERRKRLDTHVRDLRARITELGGKAYWKQLEHSADFVVMFLPNDASLAAAFERDPDLLDYAIRQRVLPATPVTLIALLKTVAYGWQQHHVAKNARTIAMLGEELHGRLQRFVRHLEATGQGLQSAVDAFNQSVGALERRVLPAARRLREAGALVEDVADIQPIASRPRTLRDVD